MNQRARAAAETSFIASNLTVGQVERALGEPAKAWVGRCYEIACAVIDRGLVRGTAVYGHWTGPIAEGSFFGHKSGFGFCQHGWVILPDGRILDPTRWVFENVRPYIYVGLSDHYDEGGNALREARMPAMMPAFEEGGPTFELRLRPSALKFVQAMIPEGSPRDKLSRGQIFWLANKDPRKLGGHARAIYRMVVGHNCEAFIPIDNKRAVDEGRVT